MNEAAIRANDSMTWMNDLLSKRTTHRSEGTTR